MCRCTPAIRTPFCGRASCQWPVAAPSPAVPGPDPLLQAARLGHRLGEIYTPEGADRWLTTPQPMLNGGVPLDMVRAGHGAEVVRAMEQLLEAPYL
jgi:hypothetical protein